MIVLAIVYRTRPEKCFEGFVDGIKSFVVPAILTVLACSVFVLVYYNPVLTPVTTLLLNATDSFSVALSGLYTIINSVFYVDYYYLAYLWDFIFRKHFTNLLLVNPYTSQCI